MARDIWTSDRGGVNPEIERVVREAGFGGLYQGDHDIALMLRDPNLIMLDETKRHSADVFSLEIRSEMSVLQRLRCFGDSRTLQYGVWMPGLRHETFFSFGHEGKIYGNFVSNGHDFSVDPVRRTVDIRSIESNYWEYSLDAEIGSDNIDIPTKVMRLYGPTKLARVEFGDGQIGLTASSTRLKKPVSFVLPTGVYRD